MFLSLALACDSPDPSDSITRSPTGSTPDTTTEDPLPASTGDSAVDSGTTCGSTVPEVALETASVTCDAEEYVTFSVGSVGVPSQGMVFAMETANGTPWSEEHDLWLREQDPCGDSATYQMRVISQSNPSAPFYERNQASLFSCGAHFEDPLVMTYAFALFDEEGALLACRVAGADPEGLREGLYDAAMINAPSFDLSGCEVGAIDP